MEKGTEGIRQRQWPKHRQHGVKGQVSRGCCPGGRGEPIGH